MLAKATMQRPHGKKRTMTNSSPILQQPVTISNRNQNWFGSYSMSWWQPLYEPKVVCNTLVCGDGW